MSVRLDIDHIVRFVLIIMVLFTGSAATTSQSTEHLTDLIVGHFSSLSPTNGQIPEWEPLVFKKSKSPTHYELIQEDGVVVIKANSQSGASGLIRKVNIDPMKYPIVEWRWKVTNILKKGDVTQKKGDDYPARIYITFAYDPSKLSFLDRTKYKAAKLLYGEYPPTGTLNYIWGSKARVDEVVVSPYTDRSMMIVVASGTEKVNQWLTHRKNLWQDYQTAFKTDAPMITGVAIMTDTDDTGESAQAFYGDIIFKSAVSPDQQLNFRDSSDMK